MQTSKFLTLPKKRQHQIAAKKLRAHSNYAAIAKALGLPLPSTEKERCDRYHYHLKHGEIELPEHELIIHTGDKPSAAPFGKVAIYLDNLRSAHNVGSIIRTVEALRLGTLYFGGSTPDLSNPRVVKTSMGTADPIFCKNAPPLKDLPRPFIALETAQNATPLSEMAFPGTFTLFVGNEEYGLSDAILAQIDTFVVIPLWGSKNSLNVSCAFTAVSSYIKNN